MVLHLVGILAILLPLFIWTGHWGLSANGDSVAVAVPAWQFARSGSLDLTDLEPVRENQEHLDRWYVFDQHDRIVSNRAPGLIAMAIPAYELTGPGEFSNGPASAVALSVTLLAVIVLWVVFQRFVPISFATSAAITLALGTTTWFVSSSELFPHGPGQLWAALAVLALAGSRYWGAGVVLGASITTRPLTGIFAAVIGIVESIRTRRLAPAFKIALVSAIGLGLLLAYNRVLFGTWNLRGGYSDAFTSGAVDRFNVVGYLRNLFDMVLGAPNGVLTTSPIIGVSVFGAIRYRNKVEPWMRSLAAASVAYLMVHAALNRASGGAPVFYRYPLESIALASPVLLVGAFYLFKSSRRSGLIVVGAAAFSIALQVYNFLVFACGYTTPVIHTCIV